MHYFQTWPENIQETGPYRKPIEFIKEMFAGANIGATGVRRIGEQDAHKPNALVKLFSRSGAV